MQKRKMKTVPVRKRTQKAPLSEGEGKGLHFPGKISYIRRKAEQHEEVN